MFQERVSVLVLLLVRLPVPVMFCELVTLAVEFQEKVPLLVKASVEEKVGVEDPPNSNTPLLMVIPLSVGDAVTSTFPVPFFVMAYDPATAAITISAVELLPLATLKIIPPLTPWSL